MRILALDVSLTATGYATSDGKTGVIEPPKEMRGIERIVWVRAAIRRLMLGTTDPADLIVIEGYSYGAQGRAILDLAELGGVLRTMFYDALFSYVEVPPATLKLFATGKGTAKKDEVLVAAVKKLGYANHDHNEADALWLLELARSHYDGRTLTEAQRRAHAKLTWPTSLYTRSGYNSPKSPQANPTPEVPA